MCAVYGPGEVKIMKELADRAFVNVTYKPRIGNTSKNSFINKILKQILIVYLKKIANKEKVIEYTIRSICDGVILTHLHPRTAINIIIQELQNDGSVSFAFINLITIFIRNFLFIILTMQDHQKRGIFFN
jgi:ribonuclease PH